MAVLVPNKAAVAGSSLTPADHAAQILLESPYHSLRHLRCRFRDGILTIDGHVPSFYLKQIAQIAVQHLDGVKRISNLIDVTA